MNALRASAGQDEVSEQHVTLPPELLVNDVFYLGTKFLPTQTNRKHWRHVNPASELAGLRRTLNRVAEFHLLAITADSAFPLQEMNQVRLYDATGRPLATARDRLFWMSLERVRERPECCGDGGGWTRFENGRRAEVP